MPLFAIIFGEIIGALAHPDPDYVRSETDRFSLYFVIAGILVGTATFLQVYIKRNYKYVGISILTFYNNCIN